MVKAFESEPIHIFPVDPCPKPRQTQSDRWKQRPVVMKYRLFADLLRFHARAQKYKVDPSRPLSLRFVIAIPKKFKGAKRIEMIAKDHKATPDLDNLIKAFKDAMMAEDCEVSRYGLMEKVWGEKGEIHVLA